MKKSNIILLTLCVMLFACKDDDNQVKQNNGKNRGELILGTWSFDAISKTYYVGSSDSISRIDTFPTQPGDFVKFNEDQTVIAQSGDEQDTTTYSFKNNEETLELGDETYDLVKLTERVLIFEEKKRIDTPYTDYTLSFVKE